MSESQFKKAVEIVGALPPDGAVKPSDDDKLYVRRTSGSLRFFLPDGLVG